MRLSWYDRDNTSGYADIRLSVYDSYGDTSGYTYDVSPLTLTQFSGTVYIRVQGNSAAPTGTYAIRVY